MPDLVSREVSLAYGDSWILLKCEPWIMVLQTKDFPEIVWDNFCEFIKDQGIVNIDKEALLGQFWVLFIRYFIRLYFPNCENEINHLQLCSEFLVDLFHLLLPSLLILLHVVFVAFVLVYEVLVVILAPEVHDALQELNTLGNGLCLLLEEWSERDSISPCLVWLIFLQNIHHLVLLFIVFIFKRHLCIQFIKIKRGHVLRVWHVV